jgi:hypothetical protein
MDSPANNIVLKKGQSLDKRGKFQVIEDLRNDGIDAWPSVTPNFFIKSNGLQNNKGPIYPLGGISQKTIVLCNESGQYNMFESDEHGYNNPKGLYRKDVIKAALTGDSFTHGYCVKPGEDIASQLRNMGINSLNLGISGNGPLIELAILKEYAEPLNPEIVLWIYYEGNDLLNLMSEREVPMLQRYFDDGYSQNLLSRQDEIDASLMQYVGVQEKLRSDKKFQGLKKIPMLWHLQNRLDLLRESSQPQDPDSMLEKEVNRLLMQKSQLALFSKILAIANQRVTIRGGKFYFVYLPYTQHYLNKNTDGLFYYREEVIAIVNQLGIPLIDFQEVLEKYSDPLLISEINDRLHYSAKGYKLVAELIAGRLRENNLINVKR